MVNLTINKVMNDPVRWIDIIPENDWTYMHPREQEFLINISDELVGMRRKFIEVGADAGKQERNKAERWIELIPSHKWDRLARWDKSFIVDISRNLVGHARLFIEMQV